ncbi:hypothetical protein ACW2QC_09470 [Virgibacillus sp. FSP13]
MIFDVSLGWYAVLFMAVFGVVMVVFAFLDNRGMINSLLVKGVLGSVCLVLVVYAIKQVPFF